MPVDEAVGAADPVSAVFVPVVIALAIATLAVWHVVPDTGILIKDGEALQRAGSLDTIVLDKGATRFHHRRSLTIGDRRQVDARLTSREWLVCEADASAFSIAARMAAAPSGIAPNCRTSRRPSAEIR